jgi:DNA-binding transcriptional LysR family regulator
MIDLDDLISFVEVVESGGFNRAAKRLGISKSIVSRRIARLEVELGIRLLSRTTRGISPTEAGLEFKARSERILAELEEAREAVAQQAVAWLGAFACRRPCPLAYATWRRSWRRWRSAIPGSRWTSPTATGSWT